MHLQFFRNDMYNKLYNTMKYFLPTVLSFLLLVSCSSDEGTNANDIPENKEMEAITTIFDGKKFANPLHLKLLNQLNICDLKIEDSAYYATCTPENFQIYDIRQDGDTENSFMLLIKSNIRLKGEDLLLPVRHILIFERENDQLVKVNGFRGDLIGMKENSNGYKDLLVAIYFPKDKTLFHCLFIWNGKQYSFDSVTHLDYGEGVRKLKEENKAEISKEVYQNLTNDALIF